MINIAIIGVGQLGSRHLQSLALSDLPLNIDLVDTSNDALKVAKERFIQSSSQGANDKTVRLHSTMESISDDIDIAIISTNSDIRADVIRKLLAIKTVKHLFLEKILFRRIDDYYSVEKLLAEKKIDTWVNCYLRSRPVLKAIKSLIDLTAPVQISVSGINWGMASACVHFMDYLAFLTNSNAINVNLFKIQNIYPSKRTGFVEVNGTCEISNDRNGKLYLQSEMGDSESTNFRILNNCREFLFSSWDGPVRLTKKINGIFENSKEHIERHSEFTQIIVEQILNGKCDLPTYQEAMKIHIPYISAFLKEFNRINNTNTDICPIT